MSESDFTREQPRNNGEKPFNVPQAHLKGASIVKQYKKYPKYA